jgi:hypothetical protein
LLGGSGEGQVTGDNTIMWIAGALIVATPIDLFIRSKLEKLDGSLAAWVRLFFYDLFVYSILILAIMGMMAATTGASLIDIAATWDWPITIVNVFIAIFFRWWVFGLFRKAKAAKAARNPTP